jgi:hypothetical protein
MAADYRQATRKDDFGGRMGAGPLATLANNPYQFSSLNYPIDIENLSHAMLFNINVHDNSNDLSKRETPAENATGPNAGFQSRRDRNLQNTPSLTRKFTRIKRAISLYMPDTIVVDNRQNFETPSLLEKLGIIGTSLVTGTQALTGSLGAAGDLAIGLTGGAAAAAAAVGDATRAVARQRGIDPNLAARIGSGTMGLSKFDRGVLTPALRTATSLFGYALNPVVEVLYVSPLLRAFNFDFIFSPKSAKEADDVWKIIYEFRRHSAPEFLNNSQSGVGSLVNYIMIPPSQFEITFLRKGQSNPNPNPDVNSNERINGSAGTGGGFVENTNLPRLSTCVLSDVMVDYTPTGGFVTFDDGMPVQIRMRLSFIETNIITREMVDEGY